MIRVQAPSRLHFGLLSIPSAERWPRRHGQEALAARRFGGAGMMVQQPGLRLSVRESSGWSAEGPLAERVLGFARRFVETLPEPVPAQHLVVEQCAPEHAGLGTGTQLALAVGQALTMALKLPPLGAEELAQRVGRGQRSALGIHGFAQGGFLVEAGQREPDVVAPLVARMAFPEAWRVVLVLSPNETGLHGEAETRAFERLHGPGTASAATDALCRLVLLGMLPALVERDLKAFGEAVHDFNVRVGEWFASIQGGTYASPRVAEVAAFLRQQGIRGVGQSSWGPTVFAVVADEEHGHHLAGRVRSRFALQPAEVLIARPANQGATWG